MEIFIKKTLNFKKNLKFLKILFLIFFSFVFFIGNIESAEGASLYPSPSAGTYTVGKNFSVGIYASSPNEALNAVSGTLTFPTDKLLVSSISKGGTVIGLWVREPAFSNQNGTISFEGIVLNPGYTGSSGRILTVNFSPKAIGNAGLAFSSGSILANDGFGTNILTGLGRGNYQINALPPKVEPPTPEEEIVEPPTTTPPTTTPPTTTPPTQIDLDDLIARCQIEVNCAEQIENTATLIIINFLIVLVILLAFSLGYSWCWFKLSKGRGADKNTNDKKNLAKRFISHSKK